MRSQGGGASDEVKSEGRVSRRSSHDAESPAAPTPTRPPSLRRRGLKPDHVEQDAAAAGGGGGSTANPPPDAARQPAASPVPHAGGAPLAAAVDLDHSAPQTAAAASPPAASSAAAASGAVAPAIVRISCMTAGVPLPSISQLEALLLGCGARAPVWRIQLCPERAHALAWVHADDARACVGTWEHEAVALRVLAWDARADGPPPDCFSPAPVNGAPPSGGGSQEKRPRSSEAERASSSAGGAIARPRLSDGGSQDKETRLYRRGVSYKCKKCGLPKKGHICAFKGPDDDDDDRCAPAGGAQGAAAPARVAASGGDASAIFQDMAAALNDAPAAPAAGRAAPAAPAAIAAGGANFRAAPQTSNSITSFDVMLADLAFAARPPPVITPEESAEHAPLPEVRRARARVAA